MGLDHLREHQISRIPGKLAWWLLTNFDARSCSLRVQDGKELHITEEDVALTLGDGGEWFKRHLAILIATMFVESNSSGYVNTNLIKNFEDVTKIGDLNWCEYIRRTLVSSKVAWTKNTFQKFIGPIIFLTVVESVQKLLGIPNPEIELTQENEEFWNDPEFIAAFDEIDNAIARREQYRAKIAERLTFSLGMTPDEVDSVIRRVQKTATQSNAQSQEQNAIDAEFNTPTGPSTEKTPNLTQ
nr:uncharacterized protein LOC109154771 [Ipomoea batatas]